MNVSGLQVSGVFKVFCLFILVVLLKNGKRFEEQNLSSPLVVSEKYHINQNIVLLSAWMDDV